jgi:hypothetical protein
MAVFVAKIANLIGWGEQSRSARTKRSKGWKRNTIQVRLDGHVVTIRQNAKALQPNRNSLRGKFIESSTIRVSHIKSFEEGETFVHDLCWLLSFATQSNVVAYRLKFENHAKSRSVLGAYNSWRPPFGGGVGKLSDFLQQTWPTYQHLKNTYPLSAFIHMIISSDLSGRVIESSISFGMQSLECIKTYYALAHGATHSITETNQGRFIYSNNQEVSFEDLLKKTLSHVGMPLPPSFVRIKRLRNALIHRGFIRDGDKVTRYIFGTLAPGSLHNAMFEIMEDVQDILREYMLRLLGYKGEFHPYSQRGMEVKIII